MKIIRNQYTWLPIPCKGYKACLCFKWLIVRGDAKIGTLTMNHEKIHVAQMKEMGYIFFYIWYGVEWFIRFFLRGRAYKKLSFEREAYINQGEPKYIEQRKPYAWLNYI